jgi:hypothetical protein
MGSELTLVFVVLFGLSAIWWIMMVLMDWLRHRRLQQSFGVLAMASTAVVILSLAIAQPDDGVLSRISDSDAPGPKPEYSGPRWTSERSRPRQTSEQTAAQQAQVDEMRRQFSPALERYRQTHGYYPATLQEAGIQTPVTLYGPLHYYGSQSEADAWYLISFGDIERDRFSADWDSRTGRWSVVELDF